jgi:hypothetical protein
MVPVNKDTLFVVATIICALGIIFLFKELNKTKQDIDNFKSFSAQVVRHLAPTPEPVAPAPVPEKKLESVEEVDEKSEE